jgi:hypothetical protein
MDCAGNGRVPVDSANKSTAFMHADCFNIGLPPKSNDVTDNVARNQLLPDNSMDSP